MVILLWRQAKRFPVSFVKLDGFSETTQDLITDLTQRCTPLLSNIHELVKALQPRGLLAMLGFRKTTGSQGAQEWPTVASLVLCLSRPHTVYTPE